MKNSEMNSFESVLPTLRKYLKEDRDAPKAYTFIDRKLNIQYYTEEDFPFQVYDELFKWITEPVQSPEHIIQLLDVHLPIKAKLDGYDESRNITPLIAFTCLEALAVIRPEILTGAWEKLTYLIVTYSDTQYPYNMIGIRRLEKRVKPATLKWIVEVCTPELCPNPCLRLELCRLVKYLGMVHNRDHFDQSLLRQSMITAMSEIPSKHSLPDPSPEIEKLPRCNAMEMVDILKDYSLTFEDIMRLDTVDSSESRAIEIFAGMIKLAGLYAHFEKKCHEHFRHDDSQTLRNHWIIACMSFLGLDPYDAKEGVHNPLLTNFIASNDNFLSHYAADTLRTIQEVLTSKHKNLDNYIQQKIRKLDKSDDSDDKKGKPPKKFKAMLSGH